MEKLAQVLSCFRNITPNKTHTVLKQKYYSTKSSSGKSLCNLLVSFIKRIKVQILLSPLIVTIKVLKKKIQSYQFSTIKKEIKNDQVANYIQLATGVLFKFRIIHFLLEIIEYILRKDKKYSSINSLEFLMHLLFSSNL